MIGASCPSCRPSRRRRRQRRSCRTASGSGWRRSRPCGPRRRGSPQRSGGRAPAACRGRSWPRRRARGTPAPWPGPGRGTSPRPRGCPPRPPPRNMCIYHACAVSAARANLYIWENNSGSDPPARRVFR